MALVAGAAFGPSATRVEVRDADTGALVASGHARHQDLGPDVDDPTAWWRSLAGALGQTGEREIAAISVCGSHPGLVLLDGAGAVLRPLQPWVDSDTAADAARLRKALGAPRWAARAGALPTPATAVSRLAWLRRADPGTFERIGAALLPHDWLTYRLAGRAVTDRGSASLTGAWSPAGEGWLGEVLDLLAPGQPAAAWEERLPRVLAPAERADWLDAPVYELLGLRGRPLVGPGTGEPMAVALALDLRPGRVAVSLGASTSALAGLGAPVVDPSGAVRSRADATGRHLAITTAPGGATLIQVVQDLLGLDTGELGTIARSIGAAADGLVLVPGVEGRDGAVLTGLSAGVQRADIARAAFDGVTCAALDAVDLLVDAGAAWDDGEPLLLSAPVPDLATHARVLADLGGRPVRPAPLASLAAAGACVQAAAVLHGTAPEEVSASWQLAGDEWVEPANDPGRVVRRIAHTEERARQRRALLDRE
jgi:xylulokinase